MKLLDRPPLQVLIVLVALIPAVLAFGMAGLDAINGERAVFRDFAMFYTAAQGANAKAWDQVYDLAGFAADYERVTGEVAVPGDPTYAYPPPLAQTLQPLARLLSVGWASLAFTGAGVVLACWQLRRWGAGPLAIVCFLLSYPVLYGLWLGQNALFSFAIVSASMLALIGGKRRASGLLLGLLVFKPQLLLAIGAWLVMAPRRHRRVLEGAATSAAAVIALSWLLAPQAWLLFPGGLREVAAAAGNGFRVTRVSAVDFAFLLLGDDSAAAYSLAAVLIAGGIWWFLRWRSRVGEAIDLELAGGVVLACWINPWMFAYEWVLLAIPAAILLQRGFLTRSRAVLMFAVLNVGAYVSTTLVALPQVEATGTGFQVVVLLFGVCALYAMPPTSSKEVLSSA